MLEAEYTVRSSDLRAAMYYPYLIGYRKTVIPAIVFLLAAVVCFFGARQGLFQDMPVVYFIAAGYLGYMAIVFAKAERMLKKYLHTPGCLVGKKFFCTLAGSTVRFRIPEDRVDEARLWKDFNAVVEMKKIFLFHYKGEQVYIVPKRAYKAEQLETARSLMQEGLGDRFTVFSLFGRRSR